MTRDLPDPAAMDAFGRALAEQLREGDVVALSGGFSTDDACERLEKNDGMIASFSRGLLQDLRHGQDDAEFDATLSGAIDQIHAASAS